MKRIASEGFNKEKLVFIGTATLLSLSLYHMLVSAPVELVPSEPVSNTPPPGPLDREKADTRVADVRFYLQEGLINPQTGLAVNRSRKNPFEPIDDYITVAPKPDHSKGGVQPPKVGFEPPPPPPPPVIVQKEEKKREFNGDDKYAKVDFSGVMTMNGVTYGLLKSKSGETIQVKEGDYLEEYQYTVAKIEKQAIWVSDEDNQMFLARDTTFDVGGSGGGEGDDKAAKKKPAKPAAKPTSAATPKPTPRPTPQVAQNNNNNNNNQRNNNSQRGGSSRGNRGGSSNTGNYQSNGNNNRGGY